MPVGLREDVTFGLTGDNVVFFDLAADRYWQAPSSAEKSIRALLNGEQSSSASMRSLAPLVSLNLLVETREQCRLEPVQVPVASESAIDEQRPPPRLSLLAEASAHHLFARFALRGRGMPALLKALSAQKKTTLSEIAQGKADQPPSDTPIELAKAFLAIDRVFSGRRRCVQRSVALMSALLRHHEHRAVLVLGVRLHPFFAHCWVQSPTHVLTDHASIVRQYAPVFIL